MAFLTDSDLRIRGQRLDERIRKTANRLTPDKDLFLSYSQLDEDLVKGAVSLLADNGAHPYVDKADAVVSTLATPTAKASHFRERIRQCGRLVLMVTENTVLFSNWTPWEVGLADGMFGSVRVATLPVGRQGRDEAWGEKEYLALYPRVERIVFKVGLQPELGVRDPADGLCWRFNEWMSLKAAPSGGPLYG